MSDRKNILELFESQKDFLDEKINTGIEKYRKGTFKIAVKDKNGKIIPNAKIKLSQKSHEFKFGANLFMLDELETPEKNEAYKKYFADIFNMATLPFYWDSTEPEKGKTRYRKDSQKLYRRPSIDRCIEFCEKHGIEPREHGLAYEHFFPDWLVDASVDEIKTELERRYSEISSRYRDKIRTIEVTNEMEWDKGKTAFYDENDFVEWSFKKAEEYFPENQLVINEWSHLPWADKCRATDKYYSYIEANLLKGARIDAIGMQYHMFCRSEDEYKYTRPFYDPENLYRHMDMYASFNKPIQITEVTVPAYSQSEDDEDIQSQIIEYLYSIWFSHKNVEQIIYWNLVDGYAAFAEQGDMTSGENYYYGGLLRFDMTPKKAYYTVKNLIQKKWHTEAEIFTDNEGKTQFKGFYGNYNAQIEVNGKKTETEISLKSDGSGEICIEI